MEELLPHITNDEDMLWVYKCRLYLRALHLFDIVEGDGQSIDKSAWLGSTRMHPGKVESWPNQQKPPSNAWVVWPTALKAAFLYRGQKLKTPLGLWMSWQSDWIWYFYPTSRAIYSFSLQTW
jgi:hypothetical protein